MIDVESEPSIIPIVAPISGDPGNSGRVINVPATPQIHVRWLERASDGTWIVRSEHAKKGWALLEDLYLAEGDRDGWAFYETTSTTYTWVEGLAWVKCGLHQNVTSVLSVFGKVSGAGVTLSILYVAVDYGGHYRLEQ